MKIYISGKITGYPIDHAKCKFRESAFDLKIKGYETVNPFDLSVTEPSKTWKDYMGDDLRGLLNCDAIFMQKDWGQSKGARIEYQVAKELGLKIIFEGELIEKI